MKSLLQGAVSAAKAVVTQATQDWVTGEDADKRTAICAACPLNIVAQSRRGRPKKGIAETVLDAGASAVAATVPSEIYGTARDADKVGKCGACG